MKVLKNPRILGKKWKLALIFQLAYLISIFIINLNGVKRDVAIPVKGATYKNWDKLSYWYFPWGESGVHKGIDIFASHKTPVVSPINGFVLSSGYSENGGHYVYIIGPLLRVYYFAHLNSIETKNFKYIKKHQLIGAVGNTGNALSKPYHLHFSVCSLVPIVKNYDGNDYKGWQKMFYLNPNSLLHE